MDAYVPRNEAGIQEKKQEQHKQAWRRTFALFALALLIVAVAGLGLFRDHQALAGSAVPDNGAHATLLAAQAPAEAMTVADVAAEANPAVVTVFNMQTVSNQGQFGIVQQPNQQANGDPQPVAAGSGWIYDKDGHVVTNAHVVAGAESLQVQFYDGTTANAKLIGVDTIQDVAVLQLELKSGQELPGVSKVGDSSQMRAGDPVVAIGSPLGEYTNSVSEGIIGGLNRTLSTDSGAVIDNLIQHDAPISSGNSGGPLLNMEGEVIGMNVAKIDTSGSQQVSASGLNFAIDGNTVVKQVKEIISTGESIAYPYLGIQTQPTTTGAGVVAVEPGSPADDAGVQAGDLITEVGGEAIDNDTSLSQLLYQHRPGDKVDLRIDRNGKTQTLTVTLGTRPDDLK
jgi:S1-C subfamily serine protease